MIAADQRELEEEVNFLLHYFAPILNANKRRDDVADFVTNILQEHVPSAVVVGCGSSALRSFLPDSDMDVVVLVPNVLSAKEEMKILQFVFNALCDEVASKDEGKSKYSDFVIRNVEFINARTKVAHCVVNNISVDMTVNQVGALSCMLFLEECDRLIGFNHLLKRSLVLIKVRCDFGFILFLCQGFVCIS
jgi:DNA polymerase sigma